MTSWYFIRPNQKCYFEKNRKFKTYQEVRKHMSECNKLRAQYNYPELYYSCKKYTEEVIF
ncbi:hypothetical protein [Caulobacter phage Cr30]|uniref:hypothetical protein n=1 Tax=Caulobacter phage Cr30 TaxID=1357714 RepID=UPI0004A9B718|nr:hypothetical protein OZ74_gp004 [Caulobacter phage Cr30]AGS80889.1 hypothetical protein [Caulobacter phage Cr30]